MAAMSNRQQQHHRHHQQNHQQHQQQQQQQQQHHQLQHNHLSVLSSNKKLPPTPSPQTFEPSELTTIFIGPRQHAFKVHRRLLCDACPSLASQLPDDDSQLWLPQESAPMFALFVQWLHDKPSFRSHLDEGVRRAATVPHRLLDAHWAMVRLHLFASRLQLYRLQDLVMDCIQDLYLKRDWDVAPSLIAFLYGECAALASVRLRRWAVAMVAFRLAVAPDEDDHDSFADLMCSLPDFRADYDRHIANMRAAQLDLRFKNPQLRIAANKHTCEERTFGFRQCSFHSHRATIGQNRCPHGDDSCRGENRVSGIYDIGRSPRPPQQGDYPRPLRHGMSPCLGSVPSTIDEEAPQRR